MCNLVHGFLQAVSSLTIIGLPDLVKSLGERPRVQEEEDGRGDGDQRDQLAQPEREDKTSKSASLFFVMDFFPRPSHTMYERRNLKMIKYILTEYCNIASDLSREE